MFLEKRVYQGSSGRVYPLPFTDRIADRPVDRAWQAVWLENEYLRVLILPELGGRIHAVQDKSNGYDLIYRQDVIKPALVGLAGPWISGGIEFNWPQHHRPATFLPVETAIERGPDGSVTVWCGDHDPLARMKGMHGVCLRPGRAWLEVRARVFNRTPFVQTFLWWANVATRVHEAYESLFPPDVSYVADHARRSMSAYPLADGHYYGVNYGARARAGVPPAERPPQFVPPGLVEAAPAGLAADPRRPCYRPDNLAWYANIPVPTSYMAMGSREDFFGGYDHAREAGLIHIADHQIAPGKKQWTWGNHPFGYAWDRNLTDPDARGEYAPYIELMAGVYTDNQPDFSFLQPGETRAWSQYWYPIQRIGRAHHANLDAAVSLTLGKKTFRVGVSVTRALPGAVVRFERANGRAAAEWDVDLAPGQPWVLASPQARKPWREGDTLLRVLDGQRREIIAYAPKSIPAKPVPPPATEPPLPAAIASADELYLTGLHLEQYRHATRCPTLYWREALRRDPLDARCNNALGLWHLRRGECGEAETRFRLAIERLTRRNANPRDNEAFYNLGLTLRYRADQLATPADPVRSAERERLLAAAIDAFAKAAWDRAWAGPAHHALAELDAVAQRWAAALAHLDASLAHQPESNQGACLRALLLRQLGRPSEADTTLAALRARDPLDAWGRLLAGEPLGCDLQTRLDVAHDCARAGFLAEAIAALGDGQFTPGDLPDQSWGAVPLIHYTRAWLEERRTGDRSGYAAAAGVSPDYCFPARLEEIAVLEAAIAANPADARAPFYLGNLLYDRRRHDEAMRAWERAARLDPGFAVVWRNLGIGYFNIRRDPVRARRAYDRAVRANPNDARLWFERDQLWKRLGESPQRRWRTLARVPDLVAARDDLTLEFCALCNQTGRPGRALELLSARHFQPWEGGEGVALGQHVRTHLALGRQALEQGRATEARSRFETALTSPVNLGEAKHLLANQSDIHLWLGESCAASGDQRAAREHWRIAAAFQGDFQEMKARAFSELTYDSIRALQRLGKNQAARRLALQLLAYARELGQAEAKIDYFATSLPTMLLFEDDLQFRQETTARFLEAQARLALGQGARARRLLADVLRRDPSHDRAAALERDFR